MGCGHLIILAEDVRVCWRVVCLLEVGLHCATEEEEQLSFLRGVKKVFLS